MLRLEVALARKLRRAMSYPELLLWQRLRDQPSGVRFRKQHPIGSYVVDFYCPASRLVIEIDGEVHSPAKAIAADVRRDKFLDLNGYRVVRIPAADVLRNADAVAEAIVSLAARPLHPSPSASGPPPRAGEDQE